jgi:hypothetical protein
MKGAARTFAALAAVAACQGGGEIRTMLVVEVQSDLNIPNELSRVDLVVRRGTEVRQQLSFPLAGPQQLPVRAGFLQVPGGGPDVTIEARGLFGDVVVVAEEAAVSFVEGESRLLVLYLSAQCKGVACGVDLTCTQGGQCRSKVRSPAELPSFKPDVPVALDGGPGDADVTDAPAPTPGDAAADTPPAGTPDGGEGCAVTQSSCGGACVDRSSDVRHCGQCDVDCRKLDGVDATEVSCVGGACVIGPKGCLPDRADCENGASDGCEADLSKPKTCGGCARSCSPTEVCSNDAGPFACKSTCAAPRTICDGSCADTTKDPNHCGGCASCPARTNSIAACNASMCAYGCVGGFGDCDGNRANGCEADTDNDVNHCGGCAPCPDRPSATRACRAARCSYSCAGGRADCTGSGNGTGDDADGCETNILNSPLNCGGCGAVCPAGPANSDPTCATSTCGYACRVGYASSNSRCLSFGGAFETNNLGGCMVANPFTATCACPPGTNAFTYAIDGRGGPVTSTLTLCQSPGLAPEADWAGASLYDRPGDPVNGSCVTTDPYTGSCNCPPTFTEQVISTRTIYYRHANLKLCYGTPDSSRRSFFGAYQKYDHASGLVCYTDATLNKSCLQANPATGSCSCPGGTIEIPIVSWENGWDRVDHQGGCPTRIVFCVK